MAFSLNATSFEHIAQGNCGVRPGVDVVSPHEPMMIAAMHRRESLSYGISVFWSNCNLMLMEMLDGWRWLTVRGLFSVIC